MAGQNRCIGEALAGSQIVLDPNLEAPTDVETMRVCFANFTPIIIAD